MATDKDSLVCDLAETYGIFNYRALPASLLATLVAGLREDSRVKMHISGETISRRDMLLAAAVDRLSLLVWALTEDAGSGANKPKSVLDAMLGTEVTKLQKDSVVAFDTAEDFETTWLKITGVKHGG